MNPTDLLIQNLVDGLKQVNQYLGIGLAASVSALVLEARPGPAKSDQGEHAAEDEDGPVSVSGFVSMPRDVAQLVLLGIGFVAGVMCAIASERASQIAGKLGDAPDLLAAALTFPSIATADPGWVVIGFVLPVLSTGIVCIRKRRELEWTGVLLVVTFYSAPYIVAMTELLRLSGKP